MYFFDTPQHIVSGRHVVVRTALALLLAGALCACVAAKPPAGSEASIAPDQGAQQRLVLDAAQAVAALRDESRYPGFADALKHAEGILIFPNYFRMGWMVNVGGGSGVLLARDAFGQWSAPAFYRMGKGGYGFFGGIEKGAYVYLFNDREYMLAGLDSGFDLGADVDVVALTTVDQAGVSRLATERPVQLYADMSGLYAGVSFSGGFVRPDEEANAAYYASADVAPENIVLRWDHWRSDACPLWEALSVAAVPTASESKQGPKQNPLVHDVYTTPH
ncbi:MAG: lipid-binding SYLF domain-containing protein [Desulfovibrio sp.]